MEGREEGRVGTVDRAVGEACNKGPFFSGMKNW